MKKIITTITMSVIIFICCTVSASAVPAAGNASFHAPASSEKPYEVTMELLTLSHNNDIQLVENAVSEYTLEKIGCTVRFKEVLVNQHRSFITRMNANDYADIIFSGVTVNPFDLQKSGLLIGLGDLLENYGRDLLEKCGSLIDACRLNNDIYFIPSNLYPSNRLSITYNKLMKDQYGIEFPDANEDIDAFLEELYANVLNSGCPVSPSSHGDAFNMFLPCISMEQFGDNIYSALGVLMDMSTDSEIVDIYETEEFYEYCLQTKEYTEKGFLDGSTFVEGRPTLYDLLNENIFCTLSTTQTNSGVSHTMLGSALASLPLKETQLTTSNVLSQSAAITRYSGDPEKCMEFLNLLYTDPVLSRMINHGLEGIHYVKESKHIINYPEGTSPSDAAYGSSIISIGDSKLNYLMNPATEADYAALDLFGADSSEPSIAFGYVFDPQNVTRQISSVTQVISTYRPGLVSGLVDVEKIYPMFIEALKTAGIDDIIAENQRQFSRWLASK